MHPIAGTASAATADGRGWSGRGDRIDEGTLGEWIGRLAGRPGDRVDIPWRRGETAGTAELILRECL